MEDEHGTARIKTFDEKLKLDRQRKRKFNRKLENSDG